MSRRRRRRRDIGYWDSLPRRIVPVRSRVPLVLFERLEADHGAGASAAVQPHDGGDLVHRLLDRARWHRVLAFDAGPVVAALPVLDGERISGEQGRQREISRSALLIESEVE